MTQKQLDDYSEFSKIVKTLKSIYDKYKEKLNSSKNVKVTKQNKL